MTALRVLMVEDSASDARLIVQALRKAGHAVVPERVDSGSAMRAALEKGTWDLVISDWSMPHFSGTAALALLKETRLDIPFIVVSGTIGEEAAVDLMRAGAQDYVLKDRLERLAPAVERELRDCKLRAAHRQNEMALRAAEARFSRLAQSGMLGIVVGDSESGLIVEANDAFLQMLGYTRDDMAEGKLAWRQLAAPEARATDDEIRQLRTSGVATPREKEYIRKDGSRVTALFGVATLTETLAIAFLVDSTTRKRTEDALRKTEEQLQQAQKMEAVGRLAGGIAHDFNNILSVILSYGELLQSDLKPGDPMHGDVGEIRKAGKRAAELTRQLLLFSRQQVVETKILDVGEILIGMQKMLQRILGEDVEMTLRTDPSLGRVRADAGGIEQVIMNLVVNARDAMPTGGQLTLETANVVIDARYVEEHVGSKAGPHVMLAVTDSGMGMDRATQARIFEPFFTTKPKDKGTGLGLSTVFGIVQRSSGTVWVYSEPGKGTTFKVYFPRVEAAVDAASAVAAPATLRGTETVLVVEDEEQVRTVVRGILRRNGYDVLEASNAGEALLFCERHPKPIHLLLTDVVMPNMSGPELARRLATSRPDMRVLCMSGYTDDTVVRHGLLDGETPYLQKPITPQTLSSKVREVLDAARP